MRNKICGIYCIENIFNNKKYIGLSRDIKRRWSEHKAELNAGSHDNDYLQRAWNKYGCKMFKFYVLEECDESILSDREKYYINKYSSMSHFNGYNLTKGGENTSIGKIVISLCDKKIYSSISEACAYECVAHPTMVDYCKNRKGYMFYDEYVNLSEEEKIYWESYQWKDIVHDKLSKAHSKENLSQSTILKYKKATSGSNNPMSYKIYCPQLDEYFDYAKMASNKYGVCYSSIIQCVNGKMRTAGKHPITGEKLNWIKCC